MTDDAMGLVNCYLGHPPPLGKRARDGNYRVAYCVREVQHPIAQGITRVLLDICDYFRE